VVTEQDAILYSCHRKYLFNENVVKQIKMQQELCSYDHGFIGNARITDIQEKARTQDVIYK
jgi:hypothetical protein